MFIDKDSDNFIILRWLDEYMVGHKGFICGGCFKNIFNGERVKDIDIFFESYDDWIDAVAYFDAATAGYQGSFKRKTEWSFLYENSKTKAYKHLEKGIVVELCCSIFGTPAKILSEFDFTVTKFAYYKKRTTDENGGASTEYSVLCHDAFFEHLHMKRLVIDDKIPYPVSSFERMLRYAKYGYFPCKEAKMKLIHALRELSAEEVELSESLYDGMD